MKRALCILCRGGANDKPLWGSPGQFLEVSLRRWGQTHSKMCQSGLISDDMDLSTVHHDANEETSYARAGITPLVAPSRATAMRRQPKDERI